MIRKMNENDNLEKIAELIYQTDESIFPFFYGKKEKAIPRLIKLINLDNNSYSRRFISLSVDDDINGLLICMLESEIDRKKEYEDYKSVFSFIEFCILGLKYLMVKPILKDPGKDEFYIQNVSVDENHRGKGIGSKLLDYAEKSGIAKEAKKLSLDVTTSNTRAYKLYNRIGFETEKFNVFPFTNSGTIRMIKNIVRKTGD